LNKRKFINTLLKFINKKLTQNILIVKLLFVCNILLFKIYFTIFEIKEKIFKMKKDPSNIFSILFLLYGCSLKKFLIIKPDWGWKFKTDDNLNNTNPDFNDSNWKNIKINSTRGKQGFTNYLSFASYGIKFVIPLVLKKRLF